MTDLAQARFSLNHVTYDLVILDLALPDGSGLDLLASLKNGGQAAVPVIVFSAHECSPEVAAKVENTLVKSRTSNEELTEVVLSVLAN